MSIVGLPYIALYVLVAIGATLRFRWSIFWASIALIFIFLAFRHEVSTDWPNYIEILDTARGAPFAEPRRVTDPAYDILNWIGANWFGGIYFVNAVCALFAVGGLAYFCARMPNPMIALAVAVPFLVIVVFAGLTRQGVSIALSLVALIAAVDRRPKRYVLFLLAAVVFHKSAFFMLLFLHFSGFFQLKKVTAVGMLMLVGGVALLILLPFLQTKAGVYIGVGAQVSSVPSSLDLHPSPRIEGDPRIFSSGALLRLLMTVVAAVILMLLALRTKLLQGISRVWFVASVAAGGLFVAAFFYSTLADRLGYYLIALQIYVMSALPDAFLGKHKVVGTIVILLGYGTVLLVWLIFGEHAVNWLPYENILWPTGAT